MSTDCDRLCVSTLRFYSTVFENKKTLHTCLDGVWSVCAWYRLRAFQLYFAYVCSRPSETERPFQPCTISLNRSLRDLSLSHTHAKTRRTAPNPLRSARCFLMKSLWLSRLPRPWHCTCSRQARTTKKHGCNAARVPDDRGYPRKQVLAQHSGERAIVQEPGSAAPRARCKSRRRMRQHVRGQGLLTVSPQKIAYSRRALTRHLPPTRAPRTPTPELLAAWPQW